MCAEHIIVQQGSDAWFKARAACDLTGSEFGAALGLNKYCSEANLFRQKFLGQVVEPYANAVDYGKNNEKNAIEDFKDLMEVDVQESGLWVFEYVADDKSKTYKFGSSPDGLIYEAGQLKSVVEIKCKYSGVIPDYPDVGHVVQTFMEMHATGATNGYLVYWTDRNGASEMKVFDIKYSLIVAQKLMSLASSFVDSVYSCRFPGLKRGRVKWMKDYLTSERVCNFEA